VNHHKNFVSSALTLLSAAGCTYFVSEPDGTSHGAISVGQPVEAAPLVPVAFAAPVDLAPAIAQAAPAAPAELLAQPGEAKLPSLADYVRSQLDGMAFGQVRRVPFGPYGAKVGRGRSVHSSICNYATRHWGPKSAKTFTDEGAQVVVVLRASPAVPPSPQAAFL
jgi:hypothetical protein